MSAMSTYEYKDERMTNGIGALPDITRSDVGIVVVSQLDATTAADQDARADAVMDSWAKTPAPGLLSASCFTSTGDTSHVGLLRGAELDRDAGRGEPRRVMTYAQWASEQAHRNFLRIRQPDQVSANESAAAAQRPTTAEYRLYRSHRNTIGDVTAPGTGIVVIVTIGFDGPDEQRLRRWIDSVVDALEAEPNPIPGMISAHFHASLESDQVFNYAEWTSEAAYDEALANGPAGVAQTDLPQWRQVRDFRGVKSNSVTRYVLHQARIPQSSADDA